MAAPESCALFAKASKKSTLNLIVLDKSKLSVSEKKEDGKDVYGKTPGGWALLEGSFDMPKPKCAGPMWKIGETATGTVEFGSFSEACKENPQAIRVMTIEKGVPQHAWGMITTKVGYDSNGDFSGGLNRKSREHVYVLDAKFLSPTEIEFKAKRRLYDYEEVKETFSWDSNLLLEWTVRIKEPPKDESDSESESGGGNALLGGDDSDSDSSS